MSAAGESGDDQPPGGRDAGRRYVVAGLEVLGVEAADDEIAVIQAVHAIYGPALEALMAEGFDDVPHEPGADMSRPPRDPTVR
jgi:hypothetical protein